MTTQTRQLQVDRWSAISSRPFDEIISALNAAIGHPEMTTFLSEAEGQSTTGLKAVVEKALGPSGFMEFLHLNPGDILAKESISSMRIQRFVIGNPLIMKDMVKHVPDAASYAPVTVLVIEEANSVRLSYDTMASLIASYGSEEASKVARDLDKKVESLLTEIAGDHRV